MSNLLLTDETFAAKMAKKKAMLDSISSQLVGNYYGYILYSCK